MSSCGTKIYSVEELKRLVYKNGLIGIERYLSRAPKSVCDIIFSWCTDSEVMEFKNYQLDKKKLNIEKLIALEGNPYEKMDFDKRIITDILFVYKNDEEICPIHREKFFNKQIVVMYEEFNKYRVLLPCCKKCKRIYISSKKFKSIENFLVEKEILYHLFDNSSDNTEKQLDNIVISKKEENEKILNENILENGISLYKDINFENQEITGIRRLLIYERCDTFCVIHQNRLIQKRIVIEGKKGKSHNFMAMCCVKCKKIFMKETEYKNSKNVLDKKNIEYKWIPIEKRK